MCLEHIYFFFKLWAFKLIRFGLFELIRFGLWVGLGLGLNYLRLWTTIGYGSRFDVSETGRESEYCRTRPDRTGTGPGPDRARREGSYITYNLKISLVPKLLLFILYVRKQLQSLINPKYKESAFLFYSVTPTWLHALRVGYTGFW